MEFRHGCAFCGWHRSSGTPVMLSPCCERCGCALDATMVARDAEFARAAFRLPAGALLALRLLGGVLAVLMLYASAKVGHELAGGAGALIAFGVGGFLLLPFVPERV
jgi:hypothetical protein